MQGIEANAVHQLGRSLDVPDGKVAPLARLERADLSESTERPRRFAGNTGDDLVDREPEQGCRHVHDQKQRRDRRGPGIAVRRDRHRHVLPAEGIDRRHLFFPESSFALRYKPEQLPIQL